MSLDENVSPFIGMKHDQHTREECANIVAVVAEERERVLLAAQAAAERIQIGRAHV